MEFKERTQARLAEKLNEEFQQLMRDNQAWHLEALKQENSALHAQLGKVKKDAENRENSYTRHVQHLKDELLSVPTMASTETQSLITSVSNPFCLSHPLCSALSPVTPWHLLRNPHSQQPTASSARPSCLLSASGTIPQVVLATNTYFLCIYILCLYPCFFFFSLAI